MTNWSSEEDEGKIQKDELDLDVNLKNFGFFFSTTKNSETHFCFVFFVKKHFWIKQEIFFCFYT